ncbi:MAG TPA: YceH family protein [Gemmatimonadaceae bacterium]|nr:YceH family protein [Gemmatimonadaceae bacterium]
MQISDVEVRILGCLIEKEATTPDNYPLSLNALTNACNQLSNREPVMSLGEDQVKWAVNSLRQQSLVRAIQPSDARVMKFQHLVTEKLDLDQPALAVLCVLMLRGAQTLGEIKTRTNRLAEFTNLADVEAAVNGLIAGELAVEMARRPGQKETRYAHLLSGPPSEAPAEAQVDVAAAEPRRDRIAELEASLDNVRRELAELRARFEEFTRQFS